jgi:hypothetical protein
LKPRRRLAKSTFVYKVRGPATGLPFINADEIAAAVWPGEEGAGEVQSERLPMGLLVWLLAS